jgi:antitoxin (DNA-binding transcriptional repressor) of toxin-antitoxin stability system
MEYRITATELARRVGDVLGRVRYRGDTFVVDRNGEAVARIAPVPGAAASTLADLARAWRSAGEPEPSFADDLERIGSEDEPPEIPWAS